MRPNIDEYFIAMAHLVASRSTCSRRSVGCVLVDCDNHVMSTGYNGAPKGMKHCIDEPCDGSLFDSGTRLDDCIALHAECNAIAHCINPKHIYKVYVTVSPCMSCMKLIVATGCRLIYTPILYSIDAKYYFESVGGVLKHKK